MPYAEQERRERLNQRLRAAFLEGAEEDSQRRYWAGLTADGRGGRIEESTGHPRGGPEPIVPSISSPIT